MPTHTPYTLVRLPAACYDRRLHRQAMFKRVRYVAQAIGLGLLAGGPALLVALART